MSFKDLPLLTEEDFTAACHHFDRRYRQATLGPIRRRWRMGVYTTLDLHPRSWTDARATGGAPGPATKSYVLITRPVEVAADPGGLAGDLARFTMGGGGDGAGMDLDMVEAEDADQAAVDRTEVDRTEAGETEAGCVDVGVVVYEIHLHPTYRVPCLWFSLHGLPEHDNPLSIDTVFQYLVPDQFKECLRQGVGGLGGISLDCVFWVKQNSLAPSVDGLPSFFVHPCLIGEAMSSMEANEEDYLAVWIGLTGGPVGLWVPTQMMVPNGAAPDGKAALPPGPLK